MTAKSLSNHFFSYAIITFITAFSLCREGLAAYSLAVYYPSLRPVKERQDALNSETGMEATVFAKFRDFNDFVKEKNPDYIIAPSSFRRFNKTYLPTYRFQTEGEASFKYLVLSTSNQWNSKNIGTAKLGVIEEMERGLLKDYFSETLDSHFKIIKSVSKPEDLFPLLIFNSVDIITVPSDNYSRLKEQFTAKTATVMESKPVEAPFIFKNPSAKPAPEANKLGALSGDTLKILGFTKVEMIVEGK